MATIQLYLRDQLYRPIDIVDDFLSLTMVRRFNGIGTWEAEFSSDSVAAAYMTENRGIIVLRDGIAIFSGVADGEFTKTKDTIRVSGHDDNILLDTPARPTPSLASSPYPDEYDVSTGVASTIMRSLVNRNIGPAAPTEWKIPNLVLAADPSIGSTITARARLDPLIVLLRELAITPIAGGLGFLVIQASPNSTNLTFMVYEPSDLSTTEFSIEAQTISDFEDTRQQPTYNYFMVAGGDDFGINRTIVEGGDDTNIGLVGRRKAQFVDARGTTDTSELTQKLAELIAGAVPTRKVNVDALNVDSMRYGIDYGLGTLVSFVINGESFPAIIREVRFEYGSKGSGEKIIPLIADAGADNTGDTARQISAIDGRLSNIERNWTVPDNSIIASMLHDTMRWEVGDLKHTARLFAQPGWLMCNGAAVSRTTYANLFATIGIAFGAGDTVSTFNIPDVRDRFLIGAGSTYSVAQTGGSATATLGAHSHTHSHGLNNHTHASQAHTHPGTHSHGIGSHTHSLSSHTHDTNIGPFSSGGVNVDTVAVGTASLGSGTSDHHHQIDPPNTTSSGPSTNTSGGGTGSTDNDSNAPSASYSGSPSAPSPNSSESDSTIGGGGSVTILNPYLGMNVQIFTGVV